MSIGHAPLRRSPSPPGKAPVPRTGAALASHPYRPNVFDDSRRRSMPYRTNGMPPGPPSSTMDRFRREDLESMQRLPPLSTIERMADGYGQAPRLSVHSPDRRMSRFAERPAPASEIPTEAEVRERRTLLVEGRRWILDMLDDTTSMLRQLDNATLHPGS